VFPAGGDLLVVVGRDLLEKVIIETVLLEEVVVVVVEEIGRVVVTSSKILLFKILPSSSLTLTTPSLLKYLNLTSQKGLP